MPSHHSHHRPSNDQSYPPLPGAGTWARTETGSAENISFVFSDRRVFCRPWGLLQGATHDEETPLPTIEFCFPDLAAKVIFEGPDPTPRQHCWQAYLDGRLETITEQPGSHRIRIRYDRYSDDFTRVYPYDPRKKKSRRVTRGDPFP